MKMLEYLVIYNTSISKGIEQIRKLSNLRRIHMNNCSLTSFPDVTHLPRLVALSIFKNHLSQTISLSPSMTTVQLVDVHFHEIPVHPDPEKLETLDVSSNPLDNIQFILLYKNLEILCLRSLNLTSIPSNIDQLEKLLFIDLSYNKFTHLPGVLFKLSRLIYLDIRGNLFPDNETEAIKDAWKKSHPTLELRI